MGRAYITNSKNSKVTPSQPLYSFRWISKLPSDEGEESKSDKRESKEISNHQYILNTEMNMEVDVQEPKIPHAIFPRSVPPKAKVVRSTLSGKRPLT